MKKEKEEKDNKNRSEKKKRKKLKWQVKLFILIILIILYAFFIGTKGIFVREFKVETDKISDEMHGFKILQISDIHYGSSVTDNMIEKMVEKANEAKPDIVIFTGDLINENHKLTTEEKDFLINNLSSIKAELGKYYVTGEEDFEEATSILNLSGFVNLENNPQTIYSTDNKPILLIDKKSCEEYFNNNQTPPDFKILALHNPNDLDDVLEYNFDMAISGHTHNGQINIIKIKDLIINGEYTSNYQLVGETKLYVNPGIGTSKINVRLFNHPTMYLYRLYKTSAS